MTWTSKSLGYDRRVGCMKHPLKKLERVPNMSARHVLASRGLLDGLAGRLPKRQTQWFDSAFLL
jgi:hypothetical protein